MNKTINLVLQITLFNETDIVLLNTNVCSRQKLGTVA